MLIFLSLLYTQEDTQRLLKFSKVGLQGAANNYQWGLLHGLCGAKADSPLVINSVPMGTYPKQCKILFEKERFFRTAEIGINNIGFINLPIIKQYQRQHSVYHKLKKIIRKATEPITIVSYSLYNPYLSALQKLKKTYKNFHWVLIVPDLPGTYGIESGNPIIRQIQRLRGNSALNNAKMADGYILLTREMADVLNLEHKPYAIIEGISNTPDRCITSYTKAAEPIILYTGALEKSLGLDVLIEAFLKLPDGKAKLYLAGSGAYVEEIKNISKKYPRIQYLGYLAKEELAKLQSNAAVLVNPRSADEVYTKYSFPSKTMEYLSTGVPVVMNKLPGIPEEYHEHLFFADNSDAESLAKKLQEVLQMSEEELRAHGIRAAKFIQEEKSSTPQAKKVIELIDLLTRKC